MKSFFLTDACRRGIAILTLLVPFVDMAHGQEPSKALIRALSLPASGSWRDARWKESMTRVGDAFSAPLWIDRRIDPRQQITVNARRGTVASLIDAMAAAGSAHAVALDDMVYLGPKKSAYALPKLAKAWRSSSPEALQRKQPLSWPRLTTPRGLAQKIAAKAGCQLVNPRAIPHDLWDAGELPPMAAGDCLLLVLIGFDLHWEHDSSETHRLRIAAVTYGDNTPEPAPLASLIDRTASPIPGEQRYTIRVAEQPLHAVLKQLCKQLDRRLELDEAIENDRISFEVRQATADKLFQAIGKAAGVEVRVEQDKVVVTPRK